MTPLARRWQLILAGLLVAIAVVGGVLLAGPAVGLPVRAVACGRVLLVLLIAATAVLTMRLRAALKRSFAAIAGALGAAAGQDFCGATPGAGATDLDRRIVGPEIVDHLAAITENMAALSRQRDEQKLAARVAQKRARHLEAVLRGLPDAVLVTDGMERVVMINDAAARLFHLPPEDAVARPLVDCIPDRTLCNFLRGAHNLPVGKEIEYSLAAQDGKRVFSVTVSPFADGSGENARGAVTLLRDVTRERAAARMKTEFVVNASHELRAPLGGIKAYLEMLMDGEVQNEQTRERFYQVMQGEVERLGDLVENILNIARIEAGIVKVSKEPVPLSGIVQEVVESMRPHAAAAGIALNDELLPVFFHVYADKEMMRRAVLNLVSNALKYTPRGGSVLVHMHVDEAAGEVTVGVSDTGVGISEQDLSRLFQKFFRVESSRKMASGTGLGLVLVKEIIENLHGGRIFVTSTLGKGSIFSIALPLVRDTQPVGASERTESTRSIP